jgi:hypothetical protein
MGWYRILRLTASLPSSRGIFAPESNSGGGVAKLKDAHTPEGLDRWVHMDSLGKLKMCLVRLILGRVNREQVGK